MSQAPTAAADKPRRGRAAFVVVLTAIVAIGAFLRFYRADHSLWLDELHTAWCVSGDFGELPGRAMQGNYSPVYPLLIWVWTSLAGLSELSLRTPSLVAGSLLPLAACWFLVRATGSRAAGLWGALLVALDRTFIEHSQEARANALVQLVVVVQVAVFWTLVMRPRDLRRQRWLRLSWVVLSALAFYLHYTGILALAGQLGWHAWRSLFGRRANGAWTPSAANYSWRSLFFDLAVLSVLCLPALPHVLEIAVRREDWQAFVPRATLWTPLTIFPLVFYLAIPVVVWNVVYFSSPHWADQEARVPQPTTLAPLLASWYLLPMLAAWLLGALFGRYVLASAVVLPLAAGWLAGACRRVWLQAIVGAGVVAAVQWHDGVIQQYRDEGTFSGHAYEDWRSAAALVRKKDPEGALPVFVAPRLIEAARLGELAGDAVDERLRRYLLFPVTNRLYWLGDRELVPIHSGEVQFTAATLKHVAARRGAWFIFRGEGMQIRLSPLAGQVQMAGHRQAMSVFLFEGMTVIRLDVDPPSRR
jgi:hypothetical protein